jgi:hypothetical protein
MRHKGARTEEPKMSYIRWEGKVRETQTRVQILDLADPDSKFTRADSRWAALCLDHNALATFPTSQAVWDRSAHPLSWCEGCAAPAPCGHAVKGSTCVRESGHRGKHREQ